MKRFIQAVTKAVIYQLIFWTCYFEQKIIINISSKIKAIGVYALSKATAVLIFVQLDLYVSNWQKVQLNTDLLKQRTQVFIHKVNGWLKLNEIKILIKSRELN